MTLDVAHSDRQSKTLFQFLNLHFHLPMSKINKFLSDLTRNLSEDNYDESVAQYRLWLDIGITHGHIIDEDKLARDVLRVMPSDLLKQGGLVHPATRLFSRFVRDIEGSEALSGQVSGLRQCCAETLAEFFEENLSSVLWNRRVEGEGEAGWGRYSLMAEEFSDELAKGRVEFLNKTNLIACWVNLGYVKRTVIRNHILQSLITDPKLQSHQADAFIILFKVAGATFGAHANPLVIDLCLGLLKNRYIPNSVKGRLVQVSGALDEG